MPEKKAKHGGEGRNSRTGADKFGGYGKASLFLPQVGPSIN